MMEAVAYGGVNTFSSTGVVPLSPKRFYELLGGAVGMNYIYECLNLNADCPQHIKHFRIGIKILILASEIEDWPNRLVSAKSRLS